MTPILLALPDGTALRLDDLVLTRTAVIARLVATATAAACPRCGHPSTHVHSPYHRTLADLPWQDRWVACRLRVRRFRCRQPDCPQAIFTERLPGILVPYAHATDRLVTAQRALGFALGGEAGSRLAHRLAMPTSPDTLLRRVKQAPEEPTPPPRYVGVDDWAIRKGHRYGTVLIDLERGRILDLLEGRDGVALTTWLKAHPGVQVIPRDRWAAFAQAASAAAPAALQVADRWHLLKNLREAVERFLARRAGAVQEALGGAAPGDGAGPSSAAAPTAVPPPVAPDGVPPHPAAGGAPPTQGPVREAKQRQREEQFQRVRSLHAQGRSHRAIARLLGIGVKRVANYLHRDRCPDWNPGRRAPTRVDRFAPAVEAWLARGERTTAALYRDLVAQGCRASYDAVRRFVNRRLGSTGRPGRRVGPLRPPPPAAPPSARALSFAWVQRAADRSDAQQQQVHRLEAGPRDLQAALAVAAGFVALIRRTSTSTLEAWLTIAEGSTCAELRGFAASLRQDEAAVRAALTTPWTNGPVEGHVNRLKTIKRTMYGRAGLPLLRARVRHPS